MHITENKLRELIKEEILKELTPDFGQEIGGLSKEEQDSYLPKTFRSTIGQDALRNISRCVNAEVERIYNEIAKSLGVS